MSLIIIHGEDQVKNRQELHKYLDKAKAAGLTDIVSLDGRSIDLTILVQNLESTSLFGDAKRLIILENLHKMKSKTELKAIGEYLETQIFDQNHLILWESKELTPTQLKKFPKAKVIVSKVSPIIFKLTDAIVPNQKPQAILPLITQACETESAEMVLIMIARQIRMLIQSFDPNNKLPPWQKAKLAQTAKDFGEEKLIALHHNLAQIDYKNKTGQLASDLKSELKFWIIDALCTTC